MRETSRAAARKPVKSKPPKGDVLSILCPSRKVLDHVTSTWGSLVMVVLLEKTHRFSELRRKIGGVSEKMLAQTLQNLEADGFVLRKAYPVIPPKVEYSLTPMGREVAEYLEALVRCVEANVQKVMQARGKSGFDA